MGCLDQPVPINGKLKPCPARQFHLGREEYPFIFPEVPAKVWSTTFFNNAVCCGVAWKSGLLNIRLS